MSTTIRDVNQTIVFQRPEMGSVFERGAFLDDLMKVLHRHKVESTYWAWHPSRMC